MSDLRKRLAEALARIGKDKELATELQDKRNMARAEAARRLANVEPELAVEGLAPAPPAAGLPKAMALEASTPNDQQVFMEETIVLRQGRPVLAIMNDEPKLEFREAESEVWRERLIRARVGLAAAARAVGRIEVTGHPTFSWLGTGWLIAAETIVTNRHVAGEFGRDTGEKFVFRMGVGQRPMTAAIDFLEEVDRAQSLEFSLVEILHIEGDDGPDVAFLRVKPESNSLATPLIVSSSTPLERQQVAVIGYPARDSRIPEQQLMEDIFGNVFDKKRLAPGEILAADGDRIEHDCSTLGGNSGSVVLDLESGQALALHFAGRFLKANYAVSGAVIMERLAQIGRGIRRTRPERPATGGEPPRQTPEPAATQRTATAPARLVVDLPITITIEVGAPTPQQVARPLPVKGPAPLPASKDDEVFTEARPEDYLDRGGYDSNFLGVEVPLPTVIGSADDILTFQQNGGEESELKYHHYSVVMSRSRRMCFFSAVNIDGRLARSTQRRGWLRDPRIADDAQIMKECYGDPPKFSRGHMTRREDPAWGDEEEADRGNRDSMHVTNTVPQLQVFNGGIWLELENYALQNAKRDRMRISVFTGPYLKEADKKEFGVFIPVRFWKIIAFLHDQTGELCATGYEMSQQAALDSREGLEFVFGPHKTTQTAITAIEEETGLSFGGLSELDPLANAQESRSQPLTHPSQIRFF